MEPNFLQHAFSYTSYIYLYWNDMHALLLRYNPKPFKKDDEKSANINYKQIQVYKLH